MVTYYESEPYGVDRVVLENADLVAGAYAVYAETADFASICERNGVV